MRNYKLLGAYLLILGVLLFILGYVVSYEVLIAGFGISCIIMGSSLLILPLEEPIKAVNRGLLLTLEDMYSNLECLLKEFHMNRRGIYTPVLVGDYRTIRVLLPIEERIPKPAGYVGGLVHTSESSSLVVTPPGLSILNYLLESGHTLTSEELTSTAIEGLLVPLIDEIEICESISVGVAGEDITVLIKNPKIRFERFRDAYPRVAQCLGSIYASVVATLLSYALNTGLTVLSEDYDYNSITITLRVITGE